MTTYLAIPISAKDFAGAERQIRDALAAGAGMLELRTDYLERLSSEAATALVATVKEVSGGHVPVIATCRDVREGGVMNHPSALRTKVLLAAVDAGAEFIDFEYGNFVQSDGEQILKALARRPQSRLILSTHDFNGRFPDLRRLYDEVSAACPEAIPKLVYTANHINDCFDAFDLLHETTGDRIVLCMGQAGSISRILAKKLGGFVTFASLGDHVATAPGQLTVGAFKGLYRYDSIDADTELFGVIADPVAHSMSPAIHNACFAAEGMNTLYLPLLVQGEEEGFNRFLNNVLARPWLGFRGFSITIPHKQSALKYVQAHGGFVEPLAGKIGAANTLIVERPSWRGRPALASFVEPDAQRRFAPRSPSKRGQDARDTQGQDALATGALAAYNTDYAGALDAITAGMGIERKDLRAVPVAIVGAGGVSRAIVAGLSDLGAKITIYNRTRERAEELAHEFGCEAAGLDALSRPVETQDLASLLINCTSIGMHPRVEATPVPAECLKPDMAVFDTVYNPAETLLLKQAREKGAKTIDGLAMFVNQAAAQFRLFTGQPANTDLMRMVVLESLRS